MPSKKTSNSDEKPSGKDRITWTPENDRRTDLSRSMGLIQLSHLNRLNWTCSRSGGWFDERPTKSEVKSRDFTRISPELGQNDFSHVRSHSSLELVAKRTLRLQDFLSDSFAIEDGLLQGSPLPVLLYIIYNSELLFKTSISFNSRKISLGSIDDVVYLVTNSFIDDNITEIHRRGQRALEWSQTHGALFDITTTHALYETQAWQPLSTLRRPNPKPPSRNTVARALD
ncbi:hypothetical protein CROQUDRAFT_92474 [Cronartium quercuum f. sp. fusiforme G11]|uniref:Reverse transcriptase domain-containing protein n=1 Tax=Cronartium quercuum f. sp. fusiforme G11 TaxID=708437 RepID=A0A9P6TBU5_9BASI|nr:hypothetical protein CROQUDRAFT_92474 [Cronartium quercuum f. sp. fusiforme G11]